VTLFPICLRTQRVYTSIFAAVLRAAPPGAGQWSLPGGKVHWGEPLLAAASREALEELGVRITPMVAAGLPPAFAATDALHPPDFHYLLAHVCGTVPCGADGSLPTLVAGDDAAAAEWCLDDCARGLLGEGAAHGSLRRLSAAAMLGPVASVLASARLHLRACEGHRGAGAS